MVDLPEDNNERDNHEADAGDGQEADAAGHEETREQVDDLRFTRGGRRLRTVIGVCLDESGSMADVRNATIEAFNGFLREQAALDTDDCDLTLCKFSSVVGNPTMLLPVAHVPHLTPSTYTPNGGTALYDAVAHVVAHVERQAEAADRVVIVVVTDGEENQSRETTKDQLRALIQAKEATGRWTFVYLSATLDAFTDGAGAGFAMGNTVSYGVGGQATGQSMRAAYMGLSHSVSSYRESSALRCETFSGSTTGADWSAVPTALTGGEAVLNGRTAAEAHFDTRAQAPDDKDKP